MTNPKSHQVSLAWLAMATAAFTTITAVAQLAWWLVVNFAHP
jgi:hypothetical protein